MKKKLATYGLICGVVVVLLIVVLSVGCVTGYGPGGRYAPGGSSTVSTDSTSNSTPHAPTFASTAPDAGSADGGTPGEALYACACPNSCTTIGADG
ncbi:MAG: hypothetical protein LBP35_03995 [Candidatus Ancillula trichonymphae]|jgi:hypothetical protein|nr:hypothetical protein [Candidatus Ancillula trichonymphae]